MVTEDTVIGEYEKNPRHFEIGGTILYFPPELGSQFYLETLNESTRLDFYAAKDAWALGLTLFDSIASSQYLDLMGQFVNVDFKPGGGVNSWFQRQLSDPEVQQHMSQEIHDKTEHLPTPIKTVIRGLLNPRPWERLSVIEARDILAKSTNQQTSSEGPSAAKGG